MAPAQKVDTAESMPESIPESAPTHDEIAALAYTLWQQRGCPDGSPEVDWLKAEAELTGELNGRAGSSVVAL
jgi:hypothetical protein